MKLKRLAVTGLVTGICDGLFATVQSVITSGNPQRVWQGVASVLLGPTAMTGGMKTTLIGLLMHFCVAYFWSAVFIFVVMRFWARPPWTFAIIYGPFIWLVMSLGVIPLLVHHPPTITPRWWVQLVGHIIFVGLPIVLTAGRNPDAR
jgi:uncharacterized membrane protein YagU involved in acid resistance